MDESISHFLLHSLIYSLTHSFIHITHYMKGAGDAEVENMVSLPSKISHSESLSLLCICKAYLSPQELRFL